MTARRALVTGAGGQDGHLLCGQLIARGWSVVGVIAAPGDDPLPDGVEPVVTDLSDVGNCTELVRTIRPDTIFHLAAISSVGQSWDDPIGTGQVNALSTVALLTGARDLVRSGHPVHVVNASSGELFAGASCAPQNEQTPICPTSPYGVAKAYGHLMGAAFRAEDVSVSNAILYPHESPYRSPRFVTRKITQGVAEIVAGQRTELTLGNLDARRDWGWAPDYVEAMLTLAAHRANDDFVVATGESHSVADFVAAAFAAADIDDWRAYVRSDDAFFRPADSVDLVGDSTHLRTTYGWHPTRTFPDVVGAMVAHDLNLLSC